MSNVLYKLLLLSLLLLLIAVPKENITSDTLTTNMVSEGTVKDSQPSLDLASATSGDKIVTAQVCW